MPKYGKREWIISNGSMKVQVSSAFEIWNSQLGGTLVVGWILERSVPMTRVEGLLFANTMAQMPVPVPTSRVRKPGSKTMGAICRLPSMLMRQTSC